MPLDQTTSSTTSTTEVVKAENNIQEFSTDLLRLYYGKFEHLYGNAFFHRFFTQLVCSLMSQCSTGFPI
jgi:hypothetical protein